MSKITINKREMNCTFNYEGDEYVITGSSRSDLGGDVTSIDMSINTTEGEYVGSANAYISADRKKPKINLNGVDTDIIVDVVTEVKDCIAKIKADVQTFNESGKAADSTEEQ